MKILYVFPHPDDESFGPAAAMWNQKRRGHEVHLLTLTRGGATKVRHELGLSIAEMGEIRYQEMVEVASVLALDSLEVLDFPDGGLADIDPRILENTVKEHVQKVQADIVVSYPVHGISGFYDHLVTYAVVKRAFCEAREGKKTTWKRFAMFTISEEQQKSLSESRIPVKFTPAEQLHVKTILGDEDRIKMDEALACYKTYQKTIRETIGKAAPFREICFQLFGEVPPSNPLSCITRFVA